MDRVANSEKFARRWLARLGTPARLITEVALDEVNSHTLFATFLPSRHLRLSYSPNVPLK